MIFRETPLGNAFVIEPERLEDQRGFFARSFCQEEFRSQGLDPCVAQCNISFNSKAGTLRGMHLQGPPHGEAKLVRCTAGAIEDAIIDLRPGSPTYRRHVVEMLTAENRRMLYIPEGFAHGFLTLEGGTEVAYQMSHPYVPGAALGFRFDDPAFGLRWSRPIAVISERDRSYADFSEELLIGEPA